jgi:hypothetical protein
MRRRFLTGWRTTIVVAAVASFVLLPLSTAFATDGPKSDFDAPDSGLRLDKEQVGETPIGRNVRFTRGNYVWPFATGPYYGDLEQAASKEPGVIRTSVGSFRVQDGLPQIPAELRASDKLAKGGKQYFVVALDRESRGIGEVRQRIKDSGGAVVATLPVDSLIVRLTPAGYSDLLASDAVIGIDFYHPA